MIVNLVDGVLIRVNDQAGHILRIIMHVNSQTVEHLGIKKHVYM